MRKYQQKQILESIKTLYEATDEIKRFLSRKDTHSVMQLLADCQEMSIQIGNYIERLEGEGTQSVSRLEEYCQLLYQANVGINNDGSDIKIVKPLQKQLIKIENSVKDELKPKKIEIVFISYKASMSDSIESIYLAAKADSCCDAFFVPIPYYDINPDNSLGTMHYEGVECYGDNIEVTDWRKYNIESRHPDAIFTFNPYDEGNRVTRVHTDYFCRNLREHTDLLVYVPYFVVADDVPEIFCTAAGCVYAHKVIVQSEKVRDTYIRVFHKNFGDRFGNARDKFVALGSPKFDKVINTKREDCVLPDEWASLTSGKKVVLYNTSIGAILNGNEQYLKKLRHVIAEFKKRDDVVLWWRPHPLSESTYSSMRLGLLEEYRAIVADYKRGGFEIWDDTPDLHRAIAMSDIYYGDSGSSLVALYRATGKDMLFQNVGLPENGFFEDYERCWPRIPVKFRDFAEDDKGNVYAFELARDGLFRLDVSRNEAYYLINSGIQTTHSGKKGFVLRYKVHRFYKNKLFCFPFWLENIFVYDIDSQNVSIIQLDSLHLNPKNADGFSIQKVFLFKDKFFCFGNTVDAIIVFDPNTFTVEYQISFFKYYGLSSNRVHFKQPYPLTEPNAEGWTLMLIGDFSENRELIRYNLETQERVLVLENEQICGFNIAIFDGEFVWLFRNSEFELLKWDIQKNLVKSYKLDIKGFVANKNNCFSDMADCGDYILFTPAQANMVVKFQKYSESFSRFTGLPMPDDSENNLYKYQHIKKTNEAHYIFSNFDNFIYKLNKKSADIESYPFTAVFLNPNDRSRFLGKWQDNDTTTELRGDAGKKIFDYVKSIIMKG